jgi:hypothetical protein
MPEPTTLLLFAGAALALLLVPGPSVIYVVTRGIHQGRAAAFVSVLGVTTATLVHTVLAAAGLSAILASSAVAFSTVKYAGSAYLVYLAIRRSSTQRAARPACRSCCSAECWRASGCCPMACTRSPRAPSARGCDSADRSLAFSAASAQSSMRHSGSGRPSLASDRADRRRARLSLTLTRSLPRRKAPNRRLLRRADNQGDRSWEERIELAVPPTG